MSKKSFLAIIVGVVFIVVVSTLVDFVLHAVGVYPPLDAEVQLTDATALIATSYRVVIGVVGAWLTARLAPQDPMKHAIVLGIVGTVLGLAGVVATWNAGMGPRWYPIALAVLALPQCWLGGRLFVMQYAERGNKSS